MKPFLFILSMIMLTVADTLTPIIQIDGLGIVNLEKDMNKPTFILGYGETGVLLERGDIKVKATTNITDKFDIQIKDVMFGYQPTGLFGMYVGHTEVPFGSYSTNCVNYTSLRYLEREFDLMFGVTGTFNEKFSYNIAAVSNDSSTLNYGAMKLGYTKGIVSTNVSFKSNKKTSDIACGVTVQPNDFFDVSFKGYKELDTDFQAGVFETSFYPNDRIIPSVRMDCSGDKEIGTSMLSLSNLFLLKQNVVLGAEYGILWSIQEKTFNDPNHYLTFLVSYIW